jgi:hypothetical protein
VSGKIKARGVIWLPKLHAYLACLANLTPAFFMFIRSAGQIPLILIQY